MPEFEIEYFKQCLAETVTWCLFELRDKEIENPLRHILSIPPETLHPLSSDSEVLELIQQVITKRRMLLESNNIKIMTTERVNLSGGKLLVFASELAFANDGVVELISHGFFDYYGYPAWDTWVYCYTQQAERSTNNGQIFEVFHIICWIPAELVEIVNHAIDGNADKAIFWVSEAPDDVTYKAILANEDLRP